MILDKTTKYLFSPFHRDVGNPKRKRIRSLLEFARFVDENNGVKDVYVSLYPYDFKLIDKIFLDLDGEESLEDAQRIYAYCLKEGVPVIPVASGKKGFHLYILVKPVRFDDVNEAKRALARATYGLLYRVFGNRKTLLSVDPHPIGDVKRLVRVPNTLRPPENKSFCTYLPPDEFLEMSWEDVVMYVKSPHVYDYDCLNGNRPDLSEFMIDEGGELDLKFEATKPIGNRTPLIPRKEGAVYEFLRRILRPCLYRHIIEPEPPHCVRVAATLDLLANGLTPEEIFDIYSKLGWRDWNPHITEYQIKSLIKLKPYSCRKLRRLGIPEVCCVG